MAEGDTRDLLPVLRGRGAPVVERDDVVVAAPQHLGDARTPCIPLTRTTRERGAVPGPGEAVVAGAVRGVHAIGISWHCDLVHAWPRVPRAVDHLHHGILHRGSRVA